MRYLTILVLALCALSMGFARPRPPAAGYVRQDLQIPRGSLHAYPYCINNLGIVGGGISYYLNDSPLYGGEWDVYAAVWSPRPKLLGFGRNSIVQSINDLGQMLVNSGPDCFIISGRKVTKLPTLGGNSVWGTRINNLGQVIGGSNDADGIWRGFLWEDGEMLELPEGVALTDINDLGVACGTLQTGEGETWHERAIRWDKKNGVVNLAPDSYNSGTAAINNLGQICGIFMDGPDSRKAVIWQPNGTRVYLPMLAAGPAFPADINDQGIVCGSAMVAKTFPGCYRACVWKDAQLILMPQDGIKQSMAVKINNRGQILGTYELVLDEPIGCVWQWR